MKKKFLSLCLTLALCLSLVPAALAVYYEPYGMRDFQEGLKPVLTDSGWNYINEAEDLVDLNQGRFIYCFDFFEGLAAVIDYDFTLGYIDTTGNLVIPCQYSPYDNGMGMVYAGCFQDGKATVLRATDLGVWEIGKIDRSGTLVESFASADMGDSIYDKGLYMVSDAGDLTDGQWSGGEDFEDDPVDPTVPAFTDVTPSDWFYDTVTLAADAGIIAGNNDGSFNPNGTLTWAQTVTFATRLMQYSNNEPIYGGADQVGDNWYDVYVDYALANGIISAVSSDPNAKISRGGAAVIFAQILDENAPLVNDIAEGFFTDVAADHIAHDAVYALAEAGVCNGKSEGVFDPNGFFKRSEVATIVARMAGLVAPAEIAL